MELVNAGAIEFNIVVYLYCDARLLHVVQVYVCIPIGRMMIVSQQVPNKKMLDNYTCTTS